MKKNKFSNETIAKMIYDNKGRVGQKFNTPCKTDSIGFEPFSKKITRLLEGSDPNFRVDETELEYDEPEGSWTDEEPKQDPLNNGELDKIDLLDMSNEVQKRSEDTKKKIDKEVNEGKKDLSERQQELINKGLQAESKNDDITETQIK